jgi:methionyl-tRNA formyltransferase
VLRVIHKKLYAGCDAAESLELTEVQVEGKKRMTAAAFLNGFTPAANEVLGDELLGAEVQG